MKPTYPAIIVVEGATDQAFISSFLDADFVITNGSEVSRETIEYIKNAHKSRDIVVLTDPDSPGKRIRDILDREIPGLFHAFVPKEHSIKHHKVGVAESTKEDVLAALANLVPSSARPDATLTFADLDELGLMNGEKSVNLRKKIGNEFHIGYCNGKTLLKRANALGLTKEDLKEALK